MILRVRDKDGKVQDIPAIVGAKGEDGVSVTEVKQIQTSNVDGGTNIIQVKLSNGQTFQFQVKNGNKGSTPVKGVDYFTTAEKQQLANEAAKQIDTSKFATLSGYNEFGNTLTAPEFSTTPNDETQYATYYPNHIYYIDDSEGMGYTSELFFPTSETGVIATREWVQANAPSVDTSEFLPIKEPTAYEQFVLKNDENIIHFYPTGEFQIEYWHGNGHDTWFLFAEDEINTDDTYTIATREWVQANAGGGGLKLTYLGNLCKNPFTGEVDVEQIYFGEKAKLFYEISFPTATGYINSTVQCGILSHNTTNWEYDEYIYTNVTNDFLTQLGVVGESGQEIFALHITLFDVDNKIYVLNVTDGADNPFLYLTKEDEYGTNQVFVKLYLMEGINEDISTR